MKNLYSIIALILCAGMLLFPLCASKTEKAPILEENWTYPESDEDTFLVLDAESETIISLSAKDYVTGVVCAEMPASYEKEALKAQAVAAYTFAHYKRYLRQNALSDTAYDVTTLPFTDQAYLSDTQAKEKYDEESIAKIKECVEAVLGEYLTYNSLPILSVYHAISSGNTESAKDVWGEDFEYLRAVESRFDLMADGYVDVKEFTTEQVEQALKDLCPSDKDYQNWFKQTTNTESGMVLSCVVAGTELKGTDIRNALSLRSSNFYVTYAENVFTFTVYGYGHGVGMSQYGANCLALKGETYDQILEHYYSGCTLKKP